jgi:hypothetical protein
VQRPTLGVPGVVEKELRGQLTGVLRDEWGFDGVVVSDYWAVSFLRSMHRVASTAGAAGALALRAGIDVELPDTTCYGGELTELVRSGAVPEQLVDRAAGRVLRHKAQLGLLDPDWSPETAVAGAAEVDLDSPANRGIACQLAERSVILLANNDGLLPLVHRGAASRTVALVGPCSDDPLAFLGCYSYPNHVLPRHPELGIGVDVPSLYAALRTELPDTEITQVQGCPIRDEDRSGLDAAERAARDAEVCIAVVGDRAGLFGKGTSGEGCDVADLALPGVQGELVTRLLKTGTPVVLVVVSGRPYALGDYAAAAAVVQAFMPGEEGGAALAGVLSGRVTPTGRLPVQVPRLVGGQPSTYLHAPLGGDSSGISNLDPTPLFPFGHGLSYTTYDYSDLRLEADEIPTDGELEVSVVVRNTGERAGDEVVQLYLHDVQAQVTRPVQQLAGFTRVALDPGAAARVTFTLHADRTSFVGADLRQAVEPGDIEVSIGRSAADLPCTATLRLTGATRTVGHDRVMSTPIDVSPLP